jgi:hypothetical protein
MKAIPSATARKYRYVFAPTEDRILEAAIQRLGATDWELIARELPGRSARQCRERWLTYLSPGVNRTPWTAEEDALLFDMVQIHGPKWGRLVGFFSNRTQNNIKNRWNTVIRKAQVLQVDPTDRATFIETGQRIVSRTTRLPFENTKEIQPPNPQEMYSLRNLLNSNVQMD